MTLQRQKIADYFQSINWMLLLFLVTMLDVKMVVKVAGIIFFLLLNRKALLDKTIFRQKFIWSYFSMIIIGVINAVITSSLSTNYMLVVFTGIGFWLMCIIAAVINYWQVSRTDVIKLNNTITFFFILNI